MGGHGEGADVGISSEGCEINQRKEPASGRGKGIPGFFGKWQKQTLSYLKGYKQIIQASL